MSSNPAEITGQNLTLQQAKDDIERNQAQMQEHYNLIQGVCEKSEMIISKIEADRKAEKTHQ